MWIVRLALRRPYTFVVGALVLLLLTPFVLLRTPTDIFPSINIPVISIVWQYAGLNAQEVEQRLVYLHERSLSATVNDIEHIESNSYNGIGVIKVFLQPGSSVDAGVAQITAVAQTILRLLPPGQQPPLIIRYNASTVPILQYGVAGEKLSEQELYDLAQNQVRVGLSTVLGAAVPWPYGGKTRVVSVDLDLTALKAKSLSAQDIVNAINAQNLILPSGTAKIGPTEYDVEVNTSPRVLDELNDLPIKTVNGATIYLRDVAHLGDIAEINRSAVDRFDGQIIQFVEHARAGVDLDVVFRRADFGGAAGQNEVLRVDGVDDVLRGEAFGLQRGQIEVHGDDPCFSAVRPGHGRAQHGGQAHPNLVLGEIIKLLLGQFFAGHTVLQDGHRGGVIADDQGRLLPRRKQAQNRLRDGGDLRDARVHGAPWL